MVGTIGIPVARSSARCVSTSCGYMMLRSSTTRAPAMKPVKTCPRP